MKKYRTHNLLFHNRRNLHIKDVFCKSSFLLMFLFLCGCSSTYTIKNYHSREEFFKEVNSSIENRDFKIRLSNDSLIQVTNGAKIYNDSLFSSSFTLPIKEVKHIEYKTRVRSSINGTLAATFVSLMTGIKLASSSRGKDDNTNAQWILIFGSPVIGILTGGTAGWFIGWNTVYSFSED